MSAISTNGTSTNISPSAWLFPDFFGARRFTAVEGSPKYLALYDLESPEVLNSAAYRHVVGAGKSAWTRRMEPQFRNFTRNVYASISDRQR
ncbi:MAG: hypothetical protein WA717_04945 [Methyloceanibacter sp.]